MSNFVGTVHHSGSGRRMDYKATVHILKVLIYHACMQLELQLLGYRAQHHAIYNHVCAQQKAHFCVNTLVCIAEGRLGCGAMRGRRGMERWRRAWTRRVEG